MRAIRVGRGVRLAPWLAVAVVSAVFLGYGVVGPLQVLLTGPTPAQLALAVGCLVSLLAVQLGCFGRHDRDLRSTPALLALAAQAVLSFAPLPVFAQAWIGMPSFFLGSLLLVWPSAAGWAAFAAGLGAVTVVQGRLSDNLLDVVYTPLGVMVFALSVYGITRLSRLIGQLASTRAELAGAVVAQERLRFARDLHDLLGLSLSAIAFKTELALRLLRVDPDRAGQEVDEVLGVARRALGDVRSVAGGYAALSLEQECDNACAVLRAANVAVRLDRADDGLPEGVRSVLATVLREAVTNVLRHSRVERCSVSVSVRDGRAWLDVVNDGVPDRPADVPADRAGSGIDNLAHRVGALGGGLRAGPDGPGRFRLSAQVPVRAGRADEPERRTAGPTEAGVSAVVTALVLVGYFAAAVVHLLYLTGDPLLLAVGIGGAAGLLAVQLVCFTRTDPRARPRLGRAVLLVQAALVYLPLPVLGAAWVSLPGFLAGSALLVLRPWAAWTAFAGVVVSVGVVQEVYAHDHLDVVFNVVAAFVGGLVVFGLGTLSRVAAEVRRTRDGLVGLVLTEERLRFARDLHDLLGLSLSAITMKSELVRRLVGPDPERAEHELATVLELARRALADVRSVARGYREFPVEEVQSALASLAATEVVAGVERDLGELPLPVRGVLAAIVHHRAARLPEDVGYRCQVGVEHRDAGAVVAVTDRHDGLDAGPGLRDRLAELGADLVVRPLAAGRTRLTAVIADVRRPRW
ncbi:histidine kinase [Actinosynnema sp. NPDC050436]|uniref:sensor histidine kinase n=1 Tax=Actinosynnema sp. NPDC050436 TaxID=3155659 RepID=UPI0033E46C68